MAARKRKSDPCEQCFPYGLAEQPADATVVSCAHGSWPVDHPDPDPKPPVEPPADPAKGDGGEAGQGGGDE